MKIKEGYMLREVAGNSVVVPVGAASLDFNGIITLNEVGAFLWEALLEEKEEQQLVDLVVDAYDVSENTAGKDIHEFVCKLKEASLLE
ncbi:MAG: PqqD family protein [Lachnospiraceae bacterium]